MAIKLIIFDWDDVFTVGSTKGYYACYRAALDGVDVDLGVEKEDAIIKEYWGKGHRKELEMLLIEYPERVEKACKLYEQAFFGSVFVDALQPVAGSQRLLQRLSEDYLLAVVSGGHPKMLKDIVLPRFGFPDVFTRIITSYDLDDVAKAKPHPYSVKMIMNTLGVRPTEVVFVGDAKNDVLMAQNAGVTPVVVLTGHLDRAGARRLGVKHIVADVSKLERVLSRV